MYNIPYIYYCVAYYACNSGTERELFSDRYYRYMQVYHSLYVTVSMIGYQMSAILTKNIGIITFQLSF